MIWCQEPAQRCQKPAQSANAIGQASHLQVTVKFHGGFGAAADMELDIDVLEVLADGLDGDVELVGDLLVDEALRDDAHHFLFALGQVFGRFASGFVATERLDDKAGDMAGHGCPAGIHLLDGAQEIDRGCALEQKAAGPIFQRTEDQVAVVINGEHDDVHSGQELLQSCHALDPGHAREIDVHQHNIGQVPGQVGQGALGVGPGTRAAETWSLVDDPGVLLPERSMLKLH